MPCFLALSMLFFMLCGCVARTPATNTLTAKGISGAATGTLITVADVTPAASVASPTPTETVTPVPTRTQTEVFTPTPDVSRFILSAANPMPESPLQASMGKKTDVATTIAELHRGPSLLSSNAEPAFVGNLVIEQDGSEHFTISCNGGSKINCAPAALLQFKDTLNGQEYDVVVLILEIKTKNLSEGRGYIAEYIYGSDIPWLQRFDHWRKNPADPWPLNIIAAFAQKWREKYPYQSSLTLEDHQPGFHEAVKVSIEDGDISQLEGVVVP